MFKYQILFFFQVIVSFSFGFQSDNSNYHLSEILVAEKYVERAILLGKKKLNDSSFIYLEDAKKILKKFGEWEKYFHAYYIEGYIYYLHKEYDNSIDLFQNLIYLSKKKLDNKNPLFPKIYNRLGVVFYEFKKYDKAIASFEEGLKYEKHLGIHMQFSNLYLNLANIYLDNYSNYDKSLEYLEKSFILNKKLGLNDSYLASYYHTKGRIVLRKGDIQKSKLNFQKSLLFFQKNKNLEGVLYCYYSIGNVESYNKNYKEALLIYNKGITLIKQSKNSNKLEYYLRNYYLEIGDIHFNQKKYEYAKTYYSKASKLKSVRNNGITFFKIARNYEKTINYDSAIFYYDKAINEIDPRFKDINKYHNLILKNTNRKPWVSQILIRKAKVFYLKSIEKYSVNLEDLKISNQINNLNIKLIHNILDDISSTQSKLLYNQPISKIYEQSITSQLLYYKLTNENNHKNKVFELAEKSKAGILLNHLKSISTKEFSGIPDSLLLKERDLKVNYSSFQFLLQSQIKNKNNNSGSTKINIYKEKIFELGKELEKIETQFEKQYPKYYQLKYNKSIATIHDIQKIIDEQTTIIEYFIGDSSMYGFTISKNDFQIHELSYIDSLESKVKNIPIFLKQKNKKSFSSSAHQLYKNLIQPLKISTKNLIIIPDAALWQLNFDLLISQKPNKQDYRKYQYLIKDHTINYTYSASFLVQDFHKKSTPTKNECLAFSYNNPDDIKTGNYIEMRGFRNKNLGDLPGTRKEIKAVSSVLDGSYYFGTYANEKNFKENAKNYNILHLALHGVIDNENPSNSKLYFTQNKDTLEDNYLHAFELYNMDLNADLAVLSACKTGSGKIIKGEGIMSLGRAFTYAGCKSLILSQWDLSDSFTPEIMKYFYTNLKDGMTKSAALREAKLTYLSKADNLTSNPYYWAPLIQLGDDKPIKQDKDWVLYIGVSVLFSVVLFFIYYKKVN